MCPSRFTSWGESRCKWGDLKANLYVRDKRRSRTPVQSLSQFSLGNRYKIIKFPGSLTPGIITYQPRPTWDKLTPQRESLGPTPKAPLPAPQCQWELRTHIAMDEEMRWRKMGLGNKIISQRCWRGIWSVDSSVESPNVSNLPCAFDLQ